ncbi:hypothetical protein ACLKA7_003210 [Drosophila subpalustris]
MKLYLLFVLLSAFVASSFALKNEICGQQLAYIGVARAYIARWSYDVTTNQCILLGFSGVTGLNNIFDSKEDCTDTCVE